MTVAQQWPGLPQGFPPPPILAPAKAGAGTGGASRLLAFILDADVVNTNVLDGVWSDVVPDTEFTVTKADALIQVIVAASALQGDVASPHTVATRLLIDGAGGSPIAVPLGSEQSTTNATANPFSGVGPATLTGLAAGVHTVRVECTSAGDTKFYCRPASQGPLEFLRLDVVQYA